MTSVWVVIQLWLLTSHGINNDEGAHLMDAWLVTNGLVPEVDFDSRQPLYVLLYTPFVALGGGYQVCRLVPLLCTLAAGLILRSLCSGLRSGTGELAATLFLYSPTIFINTAVVKTEPPAIFLSVLAFWGYQSFRREHGVRWIVVAGLAAGLGYYVRESALATFLALFLLLSFKDRTWRGVLAFLSSWSVVVLTFAGVYSRWLSWSEIFTKPKLFPPAAILRAGGKVLGWTSNTSSSVRHSGQDWVQTVRQIGEPTLMNLSIILAALLSVYSWKRLSTIERDWLQIAAAWIAAITLLYSYHTLLRGFYQYYFREFLPPLCLLGAVGFCRLWPTKRLLFFLPCLVSVSALCSLHTGPISLTGATAFLVGSTLIFGLGFRSRNKGTIQGLLVGSLLASVVYAGAQTGRSYNCPFEASTVETISAFLEENTGPDDEVLSGAVIWEFEAGRRPLGNWSHPLSIEGGTRDPQEWLQLFRQNPPAVIVWERTTRQIFSRFTEVGDALESDYSVSLEVDGIPVYVRRAEGGN